MLRDEEAAVDAMQDSFVQLLRRQDRLEEVNSSMLYTIATNTCLNLIRAKSRRPEGDDDGLIERLANLGEPEDQVIARNLLDKLFARHKVSTRTIATLYLLDGMTLEEVAGEVGMSVSGVRKRLRALKPQLAELQGV
jgi:RNA polymerase sigma-70 factor, ECF subfamily